MAGFIGKAVIAYIAMCVLYSLTVYLHFRLGFVRETRDEQGRLKAKQSRKGKLVFLGFFLVIIAAFVGLDWFLLPQSAKLGFLVVAGVNLLMMTLLVVYDSLVIDLLVIGVIRPQFLHLPEKMDLAEMKIHVKKTFAVCWIVSVLVSLISAVVFQLVFIR
ncbi:MAG: hypothetical protein JW811_06610 [Clostridiales bacterium]|nr:hypothetical protein [Clostridiales bacterium]